ncbi:MAG: hypothetical protein KF849_14095 [Rhizobiaceae bacterium]|nr:hypothetical protein [Rhizobiaceae bacterium]
MSQNTRTLIGATAVFVGLVAVAWFLPNIMQAAGAISPWAAAAVVAVVLFGLFAVLWLRGRSTR